MLDVGEDLIYLCGEEFTIPARVKNKKYVGVLGTPKVTIKAKSEDELTDKEILFENVILPWNKNNKSNVSKSEQEAATQLEDLHLDKIKEIFWNSFPHYKGRTFPIWEVVTDSGKKKN